MTFAVTYGVPGTISKGLGDLSMCRYKKKRYKNKRYVSNHLAKSIKKLKLLIFAPSN